MKNKRIVYILALGQQVVPGSLLQFPIVPQWLSAWSLLLKNIKFYCKMNETTISWEKSIHKQVNSVIFIKDSKDISYCMAVHKNYFI